MIFPRVKQVNSRRSRSTCSQTTLREGQGGVAFLELALLLPLLAALVFGGLEFARAIRVSKMVSTLSRQAASDAFRECSPVWESAQECMDEVQSRTKRFAAVGLGNIQVIVSIYRWDPVGGFVEEISVSPERSLQTGPRRTQFCLAGCDMPVDPGLVEQAGLIAIGEVYGDFTPLVVRVPRMFWFNPESLYEATIF
jgi:hypothetical protein